MLFAANHLCKTRKIHLLWILIQGNTVRLALKQIPDRGCL